jgi:predicted O-methyltransferase YrrM
LAGEDEHRAGAYPFGHSEGEIDRLVAQARLIDPTTERIFRMAGIGPGMRVLDVGTGAGDVAFLVARLVGEGGTVVGVDNAGHAIEVARRRAHERQVANASFMQGDLDGGLTFDRPFDAVVGRYVLQFQPDPAAFLRRLTEHVTPGGIVAFHELDWSGIVSRPALPLYDRCCGLIVETLRRGGTETSMGARLYATFVGAGLEPPMLHLEAMMAGGPHTSLRFEMTAGLVRTLLPDIERLGLATADDLGVETLADRMTAEAIERSAVIVAPHQVGAWSRTRPAEGA